jgi:hypothetical protein
MSSWEHFLPMWGNSVQLKISLFVRPILLLFYKEVCAANLPPMLLGTQCKGRQIKKVAP